VPLNHQGATMAGRFVHPGTCLYEGCEELGEIRPLEPWPSGARPLVWLSWPGTLTPDIPAPNQPAAYPLPLCESHWRQIEGRPTRVVRTTASVSDRLGLTSVGHPLSIELGLESARRRGGGSGR
jgi:hypothetical protein